LLLRGPGSTLLGPNNQAGRIVVRATRAGRTIFENYGRRLSLDSEGNMTQVLLAFEFTSEAQGGSLDLDLFIVEPIQVNFTFASPGAK
jgi:hypothetical protein